MGLDQPHSPSAARGNVAHREDFLFAERLIRKDDVAWSSFFTSYRSFCQGVAYKYQRGHEFDDLFSMLVVKLLGGREGEPGVLRRYDGSAPLKTYIYFVFKHLVLNHIRDSRIHSVTTDTATPIEQYGVAAPDASAGEEEDALLATAVGRLSPPDRRLIQLYHYQEMTVRQVGQMLDCDASTVSRHLRRIHEALRRMLAPDELLQRT